MKSVGVRWRWVGAGLVLALLALATVACRPRLVVRMTTVVYGDGSLTRRFELSGTKPDGNVPTEPGWLRDEAGVWLSAPEAWETVEEEPDRMRAEGFFLDVEALPGTFDLELSKRESRPARIETRLAVDDRVVVRRRDYSEHHGDPYGPAEAKRAVDGLVEMVVRALGQELEAFFGSAVDTAAAEQLLRTEGSALLTELLAAGRIEPGTQSLAGRGERWQEVLERHRVPMNAEIDEDDFWDDQAPNLLSWARGRVADAISTEQQPIDAAELTFWPHGEDWEAGAEEIVERVWGDADAFLEELEPHLNALMGYYGRGETPSFLFESRVQLPGVLLHTNGTPDAREIVWIFRDGDLGRGERELRATTAEPLIEPLRALGARRSFAPGDLLRLVDILWKRDGDGSLAAVLTTAVEDGSLDQLRDTDRFPEELEDLAAELADLLDPDVPPPEPL